MYLELLVTAGALQRDLAAAYAASDRMPEVGLYFAAVDLATLKFFEAVEPPPKLADLHETFLQFQRLGVAALVEELERGSQAETEASRAFAFAAKQYASRLTSAAGAPQESEASQAPEESETSEAPAEA
jgi:hypothetical protein